MIRSFSDVGTADLLYGADTKAARRFPLGDLAALPGNKLEALKGNQKGRYSIRVNDQFRLTFRFVGPDCHEVRCEDYH